MGWRQPGHFTHRPSVRTFLVPDSGPFSPSGPPGSGEYSPSSRLNHDIPTPIVYEARDVGGGISCCGETRRAKHLIDAGDQPLCVTAIVLVIGSKGEAERVLFNMNAIQHGQRWRNEHYGKTRPSARVKSKSEEDQFETEIRGMTDQAIESAPV